MEQIIAVLIFIWISFGDKMLNPKNSRAKRMLFFFLFYIPLAGFLTWAGYVSYNVMGAFFSVAMYAIAAFLLPFLFEKAWFASRDKEKAAFRKMRMSTMYFWVKCKNRLMNGKKYNITRRILFFILMFLPFYAVPILIMLTVRSMVPIILPFIYVIAFLTVAGAVLVFSGKRE
jgi:hypothetical protein